MSGKVIARPERGHDCAPGWRSEFRDAPPFGPGEYAIPPSGYDYPKGTIWQCDDCGQTWVSTGPPAPQSPGFVEFRRERRRERRRREAK